MGLLALIPLSGLIWFTLTPKNVSVRIALFSEFCNLAGNSEFLVCRDHCNGHRAVRRRNDARIAGADGILFLIEFNTERCKLIAHSFTYGRIILADAGSECDHVASAHLCSVCPNVADNAMDINIECQLGIFITMGTQVVNIAHITMAGKPHHAGLLVEQRIKLVNVHVGVTDKMENGKKVGYNLSVDTSSLGIEKTAVKAGNNVTVTSEKTGNTTTYTVNAKDTVVTGGTATYALNGTGTATLTNNDGTTATITGLQDRYTTSAALRSAGIR